MSPRTPGQNRRAFRISQILQVMFFEAPDVSIVSLGLMARTDLYLKIVLDHGDDEQPKLIAAEICRRIQKLYGVRSVEVSNVISPAE